MSSFQTEGSVLLEETAKVWEGEYNSIGPGWKDREASKTLMCTRTRFFHGLCQTVLSSFLTKCLYPLVNSDNQECHLSFTSGLLYMLFPPWTAGPQSFHLRPNAKITPYPDSRS